MNVLRAKNVSEAIRMQKETNGYFLAGGTYSMVEINSERFDPDCLIDLSLCPELYGIREEEASVHIGALTTFTELEKSELIGRLFPALQKAAAEVGGPQVRNRGTACTRRDGRCGRRERRAEDPDQEAVPRTEKDLPHSG